MIHTPERSKKNFEEISKYLDGFEDNSWGNDETDSIFRDKGEIAIYLPNSDKDDYEQGEWSHFTVDHDVNLKQVRKSFYSIKEVVEYVISI